MATTVILSNHNVHPVTGNWIYYRMESGDCMVEVSMDGKRTWTTVEASVYMYNDSEFARWIYGFKSGLAFILEKG